MIYRIETNLWNPPSKISGIDSSNIIFSSSASDLIGGIRALFILKFESYVIFFVTFITDSMMFLQIVLPGEEKMLFDLAIISLRQHLPLKSEYSVQYT